MEIIGIEVFKMNQSEILKFILIPPLSLLFMLALLRGIIVITTFTFHKCKSFNVILSLIAMILAYVLFPISIIIGVWDIIKNIREKYSNSSNNVSVLTEDEEQKKIIIAYIIIPFIFLSQILGKGTISKDIHFFINLLFVLSVMYLPSTIIRFLFIKDYELKQKLEVYEYMALSFIIVFVLSFLITQYVVLPGVLDVLFIYFSMSYRSLKKEYSLTVNSGYIVAVLYTLIWVIVNLLFYSADFVSYELGGIFATLVMFWLFTLFACPKYYINEQKDIVENTESTDKQCNKTIFENQENVETKNVDAASPQEEPFIPDDNLAGKLICVGLAHIGRKTKLKNKYISDESEAERLSIERPFLDLISDKFKSDEPRTIVRKKFMLFKESFLFMIYSMLLKGNPDMHKKVKIMLKNILSQSSTQADNQSRKEYFALFTKKIRYASTKTKNVNKVLRYTFWSILATKYPDWVNRETIADVMKNDYMLKIFMYSYDAIKAAHEANNSPPPS